MKRLHYFNFFGVLALAALCVAQWQRNRTLNLEVNRLESVRLEMAAKLSDQERQVRDLTADLALFKQQYAQSETNAADTRQKLRAAERDLHQLAIEREQLKTSVSNWAAAVTTRDERLKEANSRIRSLADEVNASVRTFNELASNYNVVVKDLNDLRARPAQRPSPRPPENRPPP